MPRYPRLRDIPNEVDSDGNRLCRNCSSLVPPSRRHYCSDACMGKFNRENSWFWIRKDVLRRDKWRCSICKQRFRKRELDVDHMIPVDMGGSLFDKKNLRTLCRDCHKKKTFLDKEASS